MNEEHKLVKNVIIGNTEADEHYKALLLNMMKAQMSRSRISMTALFISVKSLPGNQTLTTTMKETLDAFVIQKIRYTDVLLSIGQNARCLLLSHTGKAEAKAFLNRLLVDIRKEEEELSHLSFGVCIIEMNHKQFTYDELMEVGKKGLRQSEHDDAIHIVHQFEEKEVEKIKVSIVENDEILSNALCASLKKLSFPHFELDIQQFHDGFDFLESEFILSGHTHVVITEDILPRTNGLKVVYTLRNMPNQKKFTILMMTKRKSESDMLYAYQAGVDQYLIKPFNIRLFEAQMKRTFERFWS